MNGTTHNDCAVTAGARAVIAAMALPKVGVAKARTALRELREKSGPTTFSALVDHIESSMGTAFPKEAAERAVRAADDICERSLSLGVGAIASTDPSYPELLRQVVDHPPVLYFKGSLEFADQERLAVVGTRDASERGLRSAALIGALMASYGICIVSGLALGIDAAAHRGCLDENGTAVAVLAHGLDRVTPKSNEKLAREIVDRNGCLISEHAVGVPPRRPEYVRRNRIQSGISSASIIVETAETGGTMHQAAFTSRQGRSLYVVMPRDLSKGDFEPAGALKLEREFGAKRLCSLREARELAQRVAGVSEPKTQVKSSGQKEIEW